MANNVLSMVVKLRNTGLLPADASGDPSDPEFISNLIESHTIHDPNVYRDMIKAWYLFFNPSPVPPQPAHKHYTKQGILDIFAGITNPSSHEAHSVFDIADVSGNTELHFDPHPKTSPAPLEVDFSYILLLELTKIYDDFYFSKARKLADDPTGKYNFKKNDPDIVFYAEKGASRAYFDLSHLEP